jgi:hypothetical protein
MKKFEFLLYINKNIICQRYFSVKNFNEDVVRSLDIMYSVDECSQLIEEHMENMSVDYLWTHFNPHKIQTLDEVPKYDPNEKEDIFDFEIRIDGKTVAIKTFSGNTFPQRVRYSVDIRTIIPVIIRKLQETLSQKNFTVEYL